MRSLLGSLKLQDRVPLHKIEHIMQKEAPLVVGLIEDNNTFLEGNREQVELINEIFIYFNYYEAFSKTKEEDIQAHTGLSSFELILLLENPPARLTSPKITTTSLRLWRSLVFRKFNQDLMELWEEGRQANQKDPQSSSRRNEKRA